MCVSQVFPSILVLHVNNAVNIVSAGRERSEGEGDDARADGKGCKRMREERGKQIKVQS